MNTGVLVQKRWHKTSFDKNERKKNNSTEPGEVIDKESVRNRDK